MVRTSWALLACALLALPALPAPADDEGLAGTWKVTLPIRGSERTLWLLKLQPKDGGWAGELAASAEGLPETALTDLSVRDGVLRFALNLQSQRLRFEAKAPAAGAKKILGAVELGRQVLPATLVRTTLTSLDEYELDKERLAALTSSIELRRAVINLINQAAEKKAKPEEVRAWADRAYKAAEPHGVRWQRDVAYDLAEALAGQKGFETAALEYARRCERFLDAKDRPGLQKKVLDVLQAALEKSGKKDEAKEVEERVKKIDPAVKPVPFAGRKAKSERAVLVELFTGAQCPPCVAADLAFDALGKTYKPGEVVLLQYHQHIPGPDPLTNPDGELRFRYYARAFEDDVNGTPTVLFNGKPGAGGGGDAFDASDKYDEYNQAIAPLLEQAAKAKLKATAERKGAKVEVKVQVSDLEETGEQMRLRLALVEESVRYTGGNKLPTHHAVVRALPGGAAGVALTEKALTHTASVDLDSVKKAIQEYLADVEKEKPFPNKERPLELKKLRVVAFVQNDKTREVWQAVQVEVP